MSIEEVDKYLSKLDEPQRSTLQELRRRILAIVPDAEQGIAYGVAVFRVDGKNIAGFSAAKKHVSYLPHSGGVIASIDQNLLTGYRASKGAVQMANDTPLPESIIAELIHARRSEAGV